MKLYNCTWAHKNGSVILMVAASSIEEASIIAKSWVNTDFSVVEIDVTKKGVIASCSWIRPTEVEETTLKKPEEFFTDPKESTMIEEAKESTMIEEAKKIIGEGGFTNGDDGICRIDDEA